MNKKTLPILLALLMFLSMGASAAADTTYNTSQISTKAGDVKYYVEKHYKTESIFFLCDGLLFHSTFKKVEQNLF